MSYNESLRSDSNYPPMSQSDWDMAPWNLSDPDPIEREVTITQVLSKNITLSTTNYHEEEDEEDGSTTCYTDTTWVEEFYEQDYCALSLINEFKILLKEKINNLEESLKNITEPMQTRRVQGMIKKYKGMRTACEGWVEDELEITEV